MRQYRKIESAILTSARLSRVSDSAKWLFVLLLVAQDDEGKYPWTKPRINALIATTDWDISRTETLLSELSQSGITVLKDGFVFLRNGAEKNGTPSNSKKWVDLYPPMSELGTESEPSRNRVANDSIEKSRVDLDLDPPIVPLKKKNWEPPDFYVPLTKLPGYRETDHSKHADLLKIACVEAGVDVLQVVESFTTQYPVLRHQYGWHDPSAVLKGRVLAIQIQQALNGRRAVHGQLGRDSGPDIPEGYSRARYRRG